MSAVVLGFVMLRLYLTEFDWRRKSVQEKAEGSNCGLIYLRPRQRKNKFQDL